MNEQRSIGFEIKTLSNLLKRKMFEFSPPPNDDQITDMQGQIIDFIYTNCRSREIFQKDVEENFSIRRSTASRLLQALEKKGILERESVPYDARLKKIVLTSKAIVKHEIIKVKIDELEALVSAGLTEQELEQFFTITAKIKNNIK